MVLMVCHSVCTCHSPALKKSGYIGFTMSVCHSDLLWLWSWSWSWSSSTISNIFSSETAWPIKAKFYVEPSWEGGTKVYINGRGHMTKMAATPIYSPKVLVIPRNRWLRLNITEKLFTGTLNKNQNKTYMIKTFENLLLERTRSPMILKLSM